MPLIWTHAQYLRLARNLAEGRVTEQPAVVAERYLGRPADRGPTDRGGVSSPGPR